MATKSIERTAFFKVLLPFCPPFDCAAFDYSGVILRRAFLVSLGGVVRRGIGSYSSLCAKIAFPLLDTDARNTGSERFFVPGILAPACPGAELVHLEQPIRSGQGYECNKVPAGN
jgi:hypothetical protein